MKRIQLRPFRGSKDGKLTFRPGGKCTDEFGQTWTLEGDLHILDLTVEQNSLTYGKFPDALARLYASFFSHEGDYLIANAKPGYEFIGEGSPTHVGGASHGALHKQDTLVSMIITGTDTMPAYNRLVDIKEWILDLVKSRGAGE